MHARGGRVGSPAPGPRAAPFMPRKPVAHGLAELRIARLKGDDGMRGRRHGARRQRVCAKPSHAGAGQYGPGSCRAIARTDSAPGAGCSGSRWASQSSQRSRSASGGKRERITRAIVIRAASRNASSVSMRRSWLNTSPSDTREWTANHETQC
jgi:hypothetical protein